jgi:hypothetical protein
VKIFVSVFAAIILAGITLFAGHSMIARYSAWEDHKVSTVQSLRSIDGKLHGYSSFTASGKSIAELRSSVEELRTLELEQLKQYVALGDLLLHKPFFGLNAEEVGLRNQVLKYLRPENSPDPTPEPQQPDSNNDVPRSIVVTLDADVYNPEQHVETTIPARTKLNVVARQGNNYLVEFKGVRFSIPSAITVAQ